jgi:hypothetical protein
MKRLTAALAAISLIVVLAAPPFTRAFAAEYGVESFSASLSSSQGGAHADFTTTFQLNETLNSEGQLAPAAPTSRIEVRIPPGLTGNPNAFPECTPGQLAVAAAGLLDVSEEACPIDSQVGVTEVSVVSSVGGASGTFTEPIYNMTSPGGNVVARLGFVAATMPTFVDIRLDPRSGYGLTASLEGLSSAEMIAAATTTLWGDPTSPDHDSLRITPYEAWVCHGEPCTAPGGEPRHSGLLPTPFMTSPTRCAAPGTATIAAASYEAPDQPSLLSASLLPVVTGCVLLDFSPQISLAPTTALAESPSGADVTLTLPQQGLDHPGLLAEAHLKKAVVKLPEGMSLNPASAAGLGACTETQIGLASEGPPIRFNAAQPSCPNSSKVGTAEIETPLLPKPIQGSLYLAAPNDNPFHTLLSGYLVAQGQGVLLKVAGRFDTDPQTGRIVATFAENPQQPFNKLKLHFKEGARGVLITPPACGSYEVKSSLSPWSAVDPENPTAAETVPETNSFPISSGPDGGPCPNGRFEPALEAGTTSPVADTYSPFVLRLNRDDGTQRLAEVSLTLPPGLVGKLAGIPACPQAGIEAAKARHGLGQGAEENSGPSCPASSQVGIVQAGAGAGPNPFFIQTGKAYLAGPYGGAPLSLVVVTPALAGPFDLGNVVVQAALEVNPETAQVTAVSTLPRILHGIPLDLRDIRVLVDRPDFTLNPTNCEPMSFAGRATSEEGATAPLTERFQVAGCRGLRFKPKLRLRLFGRTTRGGDPSLRAVLRMPKHGANIASASVALPHSEFLDNAHIRTVCTRATFTAGAVPGEKCPTGSIYGHARAFSPLLDRPLEGPVYLGTGYNHTLPDLVASLNGQIHLVIRGRIDTLAGGIRTNFDLVPDAPLSKFVLNMRGGDKGLLKNSTNLCAATFRAAARFTAHNGKAVAIEPRLQAPCKAKRRRHSNDLGGK